MRNARFSLTGHVLPAVGYKAEVDLSDEGEIKMLDAFAKFSPIEKAGFAIGQMRVPFTIDAHRSPHTQYFANRSFIAKQVGNVRDVGACLSYEFSQLPLKLEAGMFNGSGIKEQQDWHSTVSYSAKAQLMIEKTWNITLSAQRTCPTTVAINMYDIGTFVQIGRLHVEAEYLYKHYARNAFGNVHAFNGFVNYDIPLKQTFSKVSLLARYDYMGNHWNGKTFDEHNLATTTDCARQRITAGVTLSIDKPFLSDIRINAEKYFYRNDGTPNTSERDKIGIEFMTRF